MSHRKILKPKWLIIGLPIAGLLLIDLTYQGLISWKQFDVLTRADAWFLALAVINQLAVYLVLVPAMQRFYASANIRLSDSRAFSMLAAGLAFARIVPVGEYVVWRTSLRGRRGAVSATTQWLIMYYGWMFAGLVVLFLVTQVLTALIYPHLHAASMIGNLRFLPLLFLVVGVVVLTTRFGWVRSLLRKIAFDKTGSQAISPLGIIRDRKLDRQTLGSLAFAALATWAIEGFTLFLCLWSLGLEVPLVLAVFTFTFARLFSIIPLAPGGAGQIETAAAVLLVAYNYPFEQAFTAALLYRLVTYWPPLLLGIGTYLASRKNGSSMSVANHPVSAAQLHRRS